MRKFALYILPIVFITIIVSCKKEGPTTVSGQVAGKWKLAELGIDNNNDGIIEPSEIIPESAELVKTFTYNSNGTGVENDIDAGVTQIPLSFTWGLISNDTLLVEYATNDTIKYHIASINASHLQLTYYDQQGLVEWFLNRD